MKKILLALSLLAFTGGVFAEGPSYVDLMPSVLKMYRLGSTLEQHWELLLKATKTDSTGFRQVYTVKDPAKGIKLITLYYDQEEPQQFYEIIIDYSDLALRDNFIQKVYGDPNENDRWGWTMPDGNKAKAWTFGNSLVIAVAFPNTEWDHEWNR